MNKYTKAFLKQFPKAWAKDGKEFDGDSSRLVWTGEGSTINGLPMFDYYRDDSFYIMGVHTDVYDWCQKNNLFIEAYDAGTYMIYED